MTLELQLKEVFEGALKTDAIVGVFAEFIKFTPEHHEKRLQASLCRFRDLYNDLPQETAPQCISGIVSFFHKQQHPTRIKYVADMIGICLKDAILPARALLECLIHHEQLKQTRGIHWCKTFQIIKNYIHLIDYKGCRDILHLMLLKLKNIPMSSWNSMKEEINAVVEAIEYLLDPEACLLPGYLAVNELRQYVADEQPAGHWSLAAKVAEFVDRFRATAAMVTTTGRSHLLPVVHHFSPPFTSTWKLEHDTLRFSLKGQLPYEKSLYERQTKLLRYILQQPYSRDMVCHVLNLQKQQKQRCDALEMELVELVVDTMEKTNEDESLEETEDITRTRHLQWQHLSSQVIYFVLFQFAVFPHMVETLYQKLATRNIKSGRDHLMWVLLQFISGSIQKNPLEEFIPVIKLVNLLYPERQPLSVPDVSKPSSTHRFAAICILMHLNRKAQSDSQQQDNDAASGSTAGGSNTSNNNSTSELTSHRCPIPRSLQTHYEYLQKCLQTHNIRLDNYSIALICNACSTANELFNGPINLLVDSIYGDATSTTHLPGENCVAFAKTTPLSMDLLDSLTVHTKMSMIHHIVYKVLNLAQSNSKVALSPAVVETYSRLLVYMETESLGIKGLINQVFPKVLQNNSLGILNTLLEMFSYRLHHIQPQYRIQLLTNLHIVSSASNTDHNQLQICVESTALRMITALSNADVKPQLSRFTSEPKQIISKESEELNRALVLTLARSIHITGAETISGSWCNDILKAIMAETPHRWASHTLKCFPRSLQNFYQMNPIDSPDKETLKKKVEEEYRKWAYVLGKDASNLGGNAAQGESDPCAYFSEEGSPPLFLCLLLKVLTSGNSLSNTCHTILTMIGRRRLSAHVRTFADFLVHEFSLDGGSNVKRYLPILRDVIWKYNLVFLDQFILCLALRCNEGDEAQVAFFIIQYLLIQPDFLASVHSFVQDTDFADHWMLNDWYTKHMQFHRKFPERFYFEGLENTSEDGVESMLKESNHHYLPVYFGNLTLRFLPVLDLVIHRVLELMPGANSLDSLLVHLGPLYKFHEQPVTYLFNTLHYYEANLRDHHTLKKKLVSAIIGSMNDTKPSNWALSQDYLTYASSEVQWQPDNAYFCRLVKRLVDTMEGNQPSPFPARDWRFNEFPNASAHALHITCVELLALPMQPEAVGVAVMDVVLEIQSIVPRKDVISWINSVALILTTLPEVYWKPLHNQLIAIIQNPVLMADPADFSEYPYHLLKFSDQHLSFSDLPCTRLLALTHVSWHHMGIGQLSLVPQFLKEKIKPHVTTELQLLYVFHLIGPFLPRFQHERTRCMIDVAIVLYDMLLQVSDKSEQIRFMDEIADFLYHIKYMHIGIAINEKVESVIERLQPLMRNRLRFITHSASSKLQMRTSNPLITNQTNSS